MMPDEPRRLPPPWSAEEADAELDRRCFVVRDANGQARWRQIPASFDHIVSASQERRRNSQSKCLGGLKVDDQL
jgi:hypothetical protein